MKKAKTLWFHLLVPVVIVFLLLWLAIAAFVVQQRQAEVEQDISLHTGSIKSEILNQWNFYQNNQRKGMSQAEAAAILTHNISGVYSSFYDMNGMAAAAVWDENGHQMESQLAYGYGHTGGVDHMPRWHLSFDAYLDDAGQCSLAQWMDTQHSPSSWGNYSLYPPESQPKGDGTVALVTGEEKPGHVLIVDRVELRHPDGSRETVIETSHKSQKPITKEFRHLELFSALTNANRPHEPSIEEKLTMLHSCHEELLSGDNRHSFNIADDSLRGAAYCITFRVDTRKTALQRSQDFLVISAVITALAALFLARILSLRINRPVQQLCQEVQRGDHKTGSSIRELNTLAEAFNGAQQELAQQLEREQQFTRNAAHELKTPLAVLRTHAEALQEDIAPEKRAHYLQVVTEETDHMTALVSRLLELSRLEAGAASLQQIVDLQEIVESVFQPLVLPLERRGMTLTMDLHPVQLLGDEIRLREAAGNLASNALRYGTDGGQVRVLLTQKEDLICFTVENDAPPIPEECLPHLFEPFYRVDKARSRQQGGTGLGLAIVKAAAEAHGGSCTAKNIPGGVQLQILLPVVAK